MQLILADYYQQKHVAKQLNLPCLFLAQSSYNSLFNRNLILVFSYHVFLRISQIVIFQKYMRVVDQKHNYQLRWPGKQVVEICCCAVVHMCSVFTINCSRLFFVVVVNKSINRKLLGSREGRKKSSTISPKEVLCNVKPGARILHQKTFF